LVEVQDVVRLTGKGIAGSSITIELNDSPVKVERERDVTKLINGKAPIGVARKEFELKPKSKGKARVEIIVKPPQPDSPVEKTVYEFEIK